MRRSKNKKRRLSKKTLYKKNIFYGKGRFSALRNLIKGGLKFF